MLGFIPEFLDERDPRPAVAQIDDAYRHGGGWRKFEGFTMHEAGIKYPGDPLMRLLAEGKLRDEAIRVYESAWVAVVQPDGSYEIARLD
jgi:hypothetical protein